MKRRSCRGSESFSCPPISKKLSPYRFSFQTSLDSATFDFWEIQIPRRGEQPSRAGIIARTWLEEEYDIAALRLAEWSRVLKSLIFMDNSPSAIRGGPLDLACRPKKALTSRIAQPEATEQTFRHCPVSMNDVWRDKWGGRKSDRVADGKCLHVYVRRILYTQRIPALWRGFDD